MAPNIGQSDTTEGQEQVENRAGGTQSIPSLQSSVAAAASLNLAAASLANHPLLSAAQRAVQQSTENRQQNAGIAVKNNPNVFLPTSAPVSSLLPPIPQHNAHPATIQSQIAALLGAAASQHVAAKSPYSQQQLSEQETLAALLTSQSAAALAPGNTQNAITHTQDMQDWPLEKLEQHVAMLERLKRPVPQTVALLLSDARRKRDKKEAKRVANRKSASTSRARKKALVQEMTEVNARLKRQALILSLLPDLVIVMDVEGVITFCSEQVERVLHHKTDELVGAKLADLLVPSSRDSLQKLINKLVDSEKASIATMEVDRKGGKRPRDEPEEVDDKKGDEEENAASGGSGTEAAIVSSEEPYFPLSVVKVAAVAPTRTADEIDTSDTSAKSVRSGGSKEQSSLTNSASLQRSPSALSPFNSGSDDNAKKNPADSGAARTKRAGSSDNNSSVSTAASKLESANDNLERNVRWHNKKMKASKGNGFKDDVTGADVTANNATARLSSLQHMKSSNLESSSEEDSGYRESNDSREEMSSSGDSLTNMELKSRRGKPLAPTCNICLIRNDLTTIWCEVTSSIRTKDVPNELEEAASSSAKAINSKSSGSTKVTPTPPPSESDEPEAVDGPKELLLCLRPIRDGTEKLDEDLRFSAKKDGGVVTENSSAETSGLSSSELPVEESNRPPKKRKAVDENKRKPSKKRKGKEDAQAEGATEETVVESLMLMNKRGSSS